MFFYEVEVMKRLVQRVIAEQPKARNEKEARYCKAGKDLKQEKQMQSEQLPQTSKNWGGETQNLGGIKETPASS